MDVKPLHYREDIERCTAYIHSHLDEELTAEQLAGKMGYSLYHFCRVFTACKGLPPMEYIRRRRLLSAAEALCRGEKIMDTALAHGFDTPGGLPRLFAGLTAAARSNMRLFTNIRRQERLLCI